MGSFHGAKVCDLVGLYIPNKLRNVFSNLGVFRDVGLDVFGIAKHVVYERTRKGVFGIVSITDFKITLDLSNRVTNVTLRCHFKFI